MISISGRKWEQKKTNKNSIEKLKQDYNFNDIVSKLVITRKFDEIELNSIDNNIVLNNVFFKNSDFKKAITLVSNTINNKEKICILGDYDVDGSAATSLFIRLFDNIKHPFFYYIPDRETDGYGATKKLFEKLILKRPKLIIMVDCGSTSNEAIEFLNQNKIKSLIIDHHEIYKPFPKANVIINPKKNEGYIEYDYLCATTLVYFFLDLLSHKIKSTIKISNYLIYALLATVCDVMPIRKLNRTIALKAMKDFDIQKNIALNELFKLNNKKNKLNLNDLGYLIGPILNAGGRLGKSGYASELLASDNLDIINIRSNELIILNNKRKKIETLILNDIDFKKIEIENKDVIIYYKPNINEGLIGIIAARLKDYFNKPAIVITNSKKILKGSARSIYNYNVGKLFKNLLDRKIILSGGGHSMAAGFSLDINKLKKFEDFVMKDFFQNTSSNDDIFLYDSEISSIALNSEFYEDIKKIEPFGTGNPVPIFLLRDMKIIKTKILNNKHISLILKSKLGFSIKSIAFDSVDSKIGEYLLNYKKNLTIAGQINENFWNNKNTLQLSIRDLFI
jgi:single-stranded-DNA-specific exonuclease